MQKFWTKYKYNHELPTEGIIQIATQAVEGYDEYLYVLFQNNMTPAQWRDLGNWTVPITARARAGLVGHCFRQKVVDDVAITPKVYYGTIEQPVENIGVFVAIDPHNLPTVYTGSDGTEDAVQYHLTYAAPNWFAWDVGGGVATLVNTVGHLPGADADSGDVYIFRDAAGDPNFPLQEWDVGVDAAELEIFVL